MIIDISKTPEELGQKAANLAALKINQAISVRGEARLIVATGSSQFEFLSSLLEERIDWHKVEIFHLDEYIGIPETHPASFRKYLNERFIDHISPKKFHSVNTDDDVDEMIRELTSEIIKAQIDVGFIGIGVNGHIAFNDPPADFNSREAYIIVNLDKECRMQQVNEGWFNSFNEVPEKAVTMTPYQIMQCRTIISVVPHKVKAVAVKNTLINHISDIVPATLLKKHNDLNLFLDIHSASDVIPQY